MTYTIQEDDMTYTVNQRGSYRWCTADEDQQMRVAWINLVTKDQDGYRRWMDVYYAITQGRPITPEMMQAVPSEWREGLVKHLIYKMTHKEPANAS